MKRYLSLAVLGLALFATAMASAILEGPPLKGEVVSAQLVDEAKRNWELSVKLLEEPKVPPSGDHDASSYKKGSIVSIEVTRARTGFGKGDRVIVRWVSYSGMGPDGPVSGLSWKFVSAP